MISDSGLHGEFARSIHRQFMRAVSEYRLFSANDRICVCLSGGKDSMLLAVLFREYEKHGDIPIRVRYLAMNPGYSERNLRLLGRNAEELDIPVEVFDTEIFKHTEKADNACFLCSKMRRGHLYSKARELGCNKIALGHHFDDVIASTLMGMIYGGQTQTMLPKLKAQNYAGMELIRPLYLIRERDIIKWKNYNKLEFLKCECALSKQEIITKRAEITELIARLEAENPQVPMNIFRSVHNVRLDRIISYKDKAGEHSFLDDYDESQ